MSSDTNKVIFDNFINNYKTFLWKRYRDVTRQEYALTYLFWECTLNCNFFCKHCGSSAGRKKVLHELTTSQIKTALSQISSKYNPKKIMIAVTGGEPLLRPDLIEVMTYAHRLGFPWGMVTNGFLVTPQITDQLKTAGMSTVVVSIDGLGETHDQFRQTPGAFNKAVNAVKILASGNYLKNIQITTVVTKHNIDQLDDMYKYFSQLPIHSWRIVNADPVGRAETNKDILLNGTELRSLLQFIKINRRTNHKIDITYGCTGYLGPEFETQVRSYRFLCRTGINIASILHNGDIFVCPNVPRVSKLIQGNVAKDNFVDIWENKFQFFRDPNRTKCRKCLDCPNWENCLGGSMHLWDFDKKQPKFCHIEQISQ